MERKEETGRQEDNETGKDVRLSSSRGDKSMSLWLTESKCLLWEVFVDWEQAAWTESGGLNCSGVSGSTQPGRAYGIYSLPLSSLSTLLPGETSTY